MADVVQYRLERMVEELDDMERRRLFSRPEIDEIVRRRRDFEYRLKRPRPIRQDFLDYVDYESKVDHLRRLRKRVLAAELRRNNKRWKRSLSDFAGVKRIVDIYRLATIKFKGDMDLWFRYLEFCRWKRHGPMRKVLAKAIRYHPKVPGLWIYAAAWEFDCNLNVTSARSLMQSGLRACPNSEDLWVEYLRMELTYLNKLKACKAALGEDSGKENKTVEMDENAKQWKEDNIDLFMPLSEKENVEVFDPQEQNVGEKTDAFQERSSCVFQTIYRGAVEAIPSSMNLYVGIKDFNRDEMYDNKSVSLGKNDLQSIFDLLGHALSRIDIPEAECLWLMRDGIAGAREMYKRFLALPRPSLAFYKHCIDLERNLAFIGDNDSLVNARKLFESALSIYNQHGGLWQDYHSMEVKVGSSETANAVYWRARKTLGDASWLSALRRKSIVGMVNQLYTLGGGFGVHSMVSDDEPQFETEDNYQDYT
ncbi:hypothetical protein QJS10_CPA01g00862 [Acorus calamus]|uniref:U3 small nucleolar RNA-associated protein 6 n=1 Tax=Acorus calamus TaxID=4465 RepID=A0AAV9FKT7_ACOCL|nr:hypothetical protein QJS10_CPA01g00862 [Acorus calamus]